MTVKSYRKRSGKKREHRGAQRKVCYVPVDGCRKGFFAGVTAVDISSGGMGFITKKAIPLQQQVAVEVALNDAEEPALMLGQVKWVEKIPRRRAYRIGMKFTKVLWPKSRARLKKHIK